jgi:hydroxyacylglutathione hydrolase
MLIEMFTVGMLGTNCFVISNTQTKEAIVIDPGFDNASEAKNILNEIQRGKLRIKFIVNTHGHPDHVSGNKMMKEATGAPIMIHEYDAPMLKNTRADKTLREGDIIEFGDIKLRVLHTPGHTKGSITLLNSNDLFVGDTLFAGSVGRYDLPGGSLEELIHSIKNKILILPDHVKVYPGHGEVTTIGEERRTNPFLKDSFQF